MLTYTSTGDVYNNISRYLHRDLHTSTRLEAGLEHLHLNPNKDLQITHRYPTYLLNPLKAQKPMNRPVHLPESNPARPQQSTQGSTARRPISTWRCEEGGWK